MNSGDSSYILPQLLRHIIRRTLASSETHDYQSDCTEPLY